LQAAHTRQIRGLQHRTEFAFQRRLDLAHDVRRGAVHHRDPVRHVGLQVRREAGEHLRGLRRGHVRQNQGHRLRVLVLHERQQLPRVGLLQERERQVAEHRVQPVDDLAGPVLAERLNQHLPGEVHTALRHVTLYQHHRVELVDDTVDRVGVDEAGAHDLGGELLDLRVAHLPEHLGRAVLAHLHQQHRCLAQTAHVVGQRRLLSALGFRAVPVRRGGRPANCAAGWPPRRAGARPVS
jgi:hypothetical protein